MTTNIPSGFLGNLSSDQEAKLKQLWTVLLKALEATFDAQGPTNRRQSSSSLSRTATNTSTSSSTNTSQLAQNLQGTGLDATQIRTVTQSLANMTSEELHRGFLTSTKNENPDGLMLRYLRARKWDVGNAFAMMIGSVAWWTKEMAVDDVLAKGELHALNESQNKGNTSAAKDGSDFLAQSRMGKSFVRGVDKDGRPIVVVRVRLHKPGAQSEEVLNQYIVHVIESVRLLLKPPVESAAVLFDMTGFSLSNMEYPPVKFIIQCFEANYPESLGIMLIHNAPWIFSGIWKLIKGWMDPVIVSKVQFTRSVDDLAKFISRDTIYKELGGPDQFEYKYTEPEQTENKTMEDTAARTSLEDERRNIVKDLLIDTSSWIAATTAKDNEQMKSTQARRQELIERLRVNYWKLDPLIRARNTLDRQGVIQEGGKVDFFPKQGSKAEKKLEVEQHESVPLNGVAA